jgi:hypothetical protein
VHKHCTGKKPYKAQLLAVNSWPHSHLSQSYCGAVLKRRFIDSNYLNTEHFTLG